MTLDVAGIATTPTDFLSDLRHDGPSRPAITGSSSSAKVPADGILSLGRVLYERRA
ncbi:hypothetical protein GM708_00795 [Vibrio cholerae]|nr:hypothetical protein [Vibrio cholerae]